MKNLLLITYHRNFNRSASTKSSSTLAKLKPSKGPIIANSRAMLTSIAILITNEYLLT